MSDLANRFDVEPEALRGMLELLERRGQVRRRNGGGGCASGCSACSASGVTIYEALDNQTAPGDAIR